LARIEGDEGAFARLRNLGYYRAVPADTDARERRAAIEEFQFDQGLTLSGTMDDDTRAKIEEIYGC
jgi:peptidoglycan hydrolase-like protein with peptidoglycan-binding domain